MKLNPPHKRHVKLPKKRIHAEDNAPVEPVVIKSHLRRLERR